MAKLWGPPSLRSVMVTRSFLETSSWSGSKRPSLATTVNARRVGATSCAAAPASSGTRTSAATINRLPFMDGLYPWSREAGSRR